MSDADRLARILDAMRGGTNAFAADRQVAVAVMSRWPRTRRMFEWADLFASRAAELGVAAGVRVVLFGGMGFPAPGGGLPHLAAAAASPDALFGYPSSSTVIRAYWKRAMAGDVRAAAFTAPVWDPAVLLERARAAGLGNLAAGGGGGLVPVQVQLGGATSYMQDGQAAAAVAGYAELLAAGSEVVAWVPDGPEAGEFAAALGTVRHTAESAARWMTAAGLKIVGSPADVRWWGTWARPEFEGRDPVRMVGVVGWKAG